MSIEFFVILLIIFVSIFDPLRDTSWKDKSKSWIVKHIYKWLAFYPPLIFLALYFLPWWVTVMLACTCFLIWNLSLRLIAKNKDWNKWFPQL